MNRVLFFTEDDRKALAVAELSERSGLTFRRVLVSEAVKTIGELVMDPEPFVMKAPVTVDPEDLPDPAALLSPMREFLLLAGMQGDETDRFLSALRTSEIGPIPLKAMLTMHNIFWTPRTLSYHLAEEHQTFAGRKRPS